MFHKFVSRYVIEGELTAVTALHIGAAENVFAPNGCKNPFFRNANGQPLIPGSSLKGVMRGFLEQYLSSDSGRRMIPEDVPYRREICSEQSPCIDLKRKEEKDKLKELEKRGSQKLSEYLFGEGEEKGRLCIVCRLFGSPCSAAKFNVRDARVVEETFQGSFEIRSGVGIDRNFGTAADGKKFDIEVVPEGTVFSMRAVLENADETEWKIIKQLFRAMELGMVSIGGMKSRGLGEISLKDVRYQSITEENIADYLSGEQIGFRYLNTESEG